MADTLRGDARGEWPIGEVAYDWRLRNSKLLDTDAAALIEMGHRAFREGWGLYSEQLPIPWGSSRPTRRRR